MSVHVLDWDRSLVLGAGRDPSFPGPDRTRQGRAQSGCATKDSGSPVRTMWILPLRPRVGIRGVAGVGVGTSARHRTNCMIIKILEISWKSSSLPAMVHFKRFLFDADLLSPHPNRQIALLSEDKEEVERVPAVQPS